MQEKHVRVFAFQGNLLEVWVGLGLLLKVKGEVTGNGADKVGETLQQRFPTGLKLGTMGLCGQFHR